MLGKLLLYLPAEKLIYMKHHKLDMHGSLRVGFVPSVALLYLVSRKGLVSWQEGLPERWNCALDCP